MVLESMTGYSRSDGVLKLGVPEQTWRWTWELRSVNSKGFDLRSKLPPGRQSLEISAKKEIMTQITRGSITAHLIRKEDLTEKKVVINEQFLEQLCDTHQRLKKAGIVAETAPVLDRLLLVPGAVAVEREQELNSDENQILDNAILESLKDALSALISVRKKEGTQVSNILEKQLSELLELCDRARVIADTNRHQISDTLEEQIGLISKMKVTLSEERLEQELAVLLTKLDVTEEVDRLSIHLDSCMQLLKAGRIVGRRLDFICQELNREANTLCSKSSDKGLTSIGIDLKVGIEKFREQIQNIQ